MNLWGARRHFFSPIGALRVRLVVLSFLPGYRNDLAVVEGNISREAEPYRRIHDAGNLHALDHPALGRIDQAAHRCGRGITTQDDHRVISTLGVATAWSTRESNATGARTTAITNRAAAAPTARSRQWTVAAARPAARAVSVAAALAEPAVLVMAAREAGKAAARPALRRRAAARRRAARRRRAAGRRRAERSPPTAAEDGERSRRLAAVADAARPGQKAGEQRCRPAFSLCWFC